MSEGKLTTTWKRCKHLENKKRGQLIFYPKTHCIIGFDFSKVHIIFNIIYSSFSI